MIKESLKANDSIFEALVMESAIGIVMVDQDGMIVASNRYANALFGYDTDELIGQPIELLVPSNIEHKHKGYVRGYMSKPQVRPMGIGLDLKGRRKNNSLFSVEVSLSHFEQNGQSFIISFINDVTAKKKSDLELILKNEEIKKLNENLEKEVLNRTNALVETLNDLEEKKRALELSLKKEKELGELKSRFVSMASHEFRTPLTSILSSASLIEKYPKAEEQDKRIRHLQRIKTSVGYLTDILEEFLSVGKLEEGKISTNFCRFSLTDLVQECFTDLTSLAKKGQQLSYKHEGKEEVYLDKSLTRKIIFNLCSNAIKFSNEDDTITVSSLHNSHNLRICVKDEGIGISPEDQKHLFDRFFRGANVTNIQGTGLGLHIVARYTELMQGNVSIESELSKGTTICVTFPV
jgi:PAS domain S-box-containing protein